MGTAPMTCSPSARLLILAVNHGAQPCRIPPQQRCVTRLAYPT